MGSIPGQGIKRERELSYLVVFERVGWVPCSRIPVFLLLLVPIFLIASQGSSWEEITLSCNTEKVFPIVMYRCESWTIKKAEHWGLMVLNCGAGEEFWESLGQQGNQTCQSLRKPTLNIYWNDWCWSWIRIDAEYPLEATWCDKPTHWKRPWCWERLRAR